MKQDANDGYRTQRLEPEHIQYRDDLFVLLLFVPLVFLFDLFYILEFLPPVFQTVDLGYAAEGSEGFLRRAVGDRVERGFLNIVDDSEEHHEEGSQLVNDEDQLPRLYGLKHNSVAGNAEREKEIAYHYVLTTLLLSYRFGDDAWYNIDLH